MINLPNKFERYTAALRNYLQIKSIKSGFDKKYIKNLKKIYIAESILCPDDELPINMNIYLYKLLTAVHIAKTEKNIPFQFKLSISGTFILKTKIFTALLLTLINFSFIEISYHKGYIKITVPNKISNKTHYLIKRLKGNCFFEIKQRKTLIIIPAVSTDKKPVKTEESVENYILNPFSPVNIFI